jgi:hypothetical protein
MVKNAHHLIYPRGIISGRNALPVDVLHNQISIVTQDKGAIYFWDADNLGVQQLSSDYLILSFLLHTGGLEQP